MRLRPYQSGASNSVFAEWESGIVSTLGVMPTGSGKTVCFADIIRRAFPRRAMVIAHRQELIFQARDKIRATTGLSVDVEMGEHRSAENCQNGRLFGGSGRAHVVVSTVQTHTAGGDGMGRMGKFNPMDFGLLVIDEAHHAISASYRRVIDYYRTNPNLKVLGVTATPDRGDEEALGQVFESVAFDYELRDLIHDGWLVPIQQHEITIDGLDYSSIRTTAGDLNGSDLATVMENEKNLHGIASASIESIGDKRSLVFTSSVAHAQKLSEIFNRHRVGCSSWVCGATPKDERAAILADFKRGKLQAVCNCAVLTEGFDDPGVEVVIMARPTKSRALYAQMLGRATRPHDSIAHTLNDADDRPALIASSPKPSCTVIDFVGNSGKHKLITPADILGGKVNDRVIEAVMLRARKAGKPVNTQELIEEEEAREIEREQRRLEEEARRSRLTVKASFKSQSVDPFDILQLKPVASRGWDKGKTLTEKQSNFLRKAGINPDTMEYGKARQLINAMMDRFTNHLCTLGQAKVLRKFGCDTNISFDLASKTIDAIAKNGWRKPSVMPTEAAPVSVNDNVPF